MVQIRALEGGDAGGRAVVRASDMTTDTRTADMRRAARTTRRTRLSWVTKALALVVGFAAAACADRAVAADAAPAGPALAGPACGAEIACTVPLGTYRIALPPDGRVDGALVFFHGYQSSAAEQMHAADLVAVANARHLAFVAPDGLGRTWSHDHAVAHDRDEIAFFEQVRSELVRRWHVPADRVIVGGFSQGASMAWYVVCHDGGRVAAAVTFSGVFWNPLPTRAECPSTPPVMIHFHGTADETFPLAGRAIGARWHQGDTFLSLDLVRSWGRCRVSPPTSRTIAGVACAVTDGCDRGPILACIHDAGHEVRAPWLAGALDALTGPDGLLAARHGEAAR